MDFDSWTHRTIDRDRTRRLFVGAALAAVVICSTVVALAMSSKGPLEEAPEENVLEVQLAKEPEPEPEPEAEPEPEPEVNPNPAPRPAGPVLPQMTTPTEIPDDAPTEKEVDPSANPYASGDPYQFGAGQAGTGPRTATVVKAEAPKAVVVTKPSGPSRMTADTTPPQVLSPGPNVYPPDAKAAGIEGKVVVKLVIDESGTLTEARAVKGPDALRAACEDRWKNTKFSPAMRDGQPVSIQLIKICNFKLTT